MNGGNTICPMQLDGIERNFKTLFDCDRQYPNFDHISMVHFSPNYNLADICFPKGDFDVFGKAASIEPDSKIRQIGYVIKDNSQITFILYDFPMLENVRIHENIGFFIPVFRLFFPPKGSQVQLLTTRHEKKANNPITSCDFELIIEVNS